MAALRQAGETGAVPAAVRLSLEVEPDSEPISGRLSDASGAERPFTGWLDLAAALEAMLSPGDPTSAQRGLEQAGGSHEL